MDQGKMLIRLIGFAIPAALVGSLSGAMLYYLYGLATFYLDLYRQVGEHAFDMGLMAPDFTATFPISAMVSLIFTIPATLIIGVPLAYGFRGRIFAYPKTSTLTFTIFGAILAPVLMKLIFKNADVIVPALPFFGGATAFAYGVLLLCFRHHLYAEAR